MSADHGGWPERREDGSLPPEFHPGTGADEPPPLPAKPPAMPPPAMPPPASPEPPPVARTWVMPPDPPVGPAGPAPGVPPPAVPPAFGPGFGPGISPGYGPGFTPVGPAVPPVGVPQMPGQQPYGPPAYQFPVPPRRTSAARTALVAGIGGAVVVVAAAVVILFVMLGGDDDKSGREAAAPSRSAGATAPAPAPATTGAAPGTSRPSAVAEPFALPSSVGGVPGVPDDEASASVRDITSAFARDFDGVRTMVYQESRSTEGTLFSTGVRRDVEPTDFVRDFVPASEAAVETDLPAGLWRQPGLIRCWDGPRSVVCLWGDDTRMLFGSSTDTVGGLVSRMEGIYLNGTAS